MNNEEATKLLQKTQLEILKDFQALCDKHKIPYFASGGTAIGAIRHKGFIPWDDDIDICLLRRDYNKVIYYIRKELNDKYEIYDNKSVDGYVLVFAKMCKKGTYIKEDGGFDTCVPTGIFLDLFAYDKTTTNPKKRKKQIRDTWIWARLCVLSEYKYPQFPKNLDGILLKVSKIGCIAVHYVLRVLHLKKNFFYKQYLKAAMRYRNSKEELYTDFSYVDPEKLLCTREMIFPLRKMQFENIQINMLNGADKYLRSQFGDYMKLPPVEQRKTHNPRYIDFGDGITFKKPIR
jgi:lipopolysaccharide cholinephosphotransferase